MPTFRYVEKYEPLKEVPDGTTELICGFNGLEKLPKLPESLIELRCAHNLLKELPRLPDLEKLVCDVNQLRSLPKLPNTLNILKCGNNRLTELPKLPDTLLTLTCNHNNLRKLPLLPESLKVISIDNNPWEEPFASYIRKSRGDTKKLKKLIKEHYALEAIVNNVTAHNVTLGAKKLKNNEELYNNPLPEVVTNHIRSFLMPPEGTKARGIGNTTKKQRNALKNLFAALKRGGGTRKAHRRTRRH
jgi:hypothetical protein